MSNQNSKPKIIVVLGPTASGKSELAVKIALRLNSGQAKKIYSINGGEIISADSRQVYKGLDIGSGKVPRDLIYRKSDFLYMEVRLPYIYKGIIHHLIDVASPKKVFTVSQYQKLARKAIKKILNKNKVPIICGGTGLYIDSIIYNLQFPSVPPQPKLRRKLEKLSTEKLFEKLQKLDPQRAKNIDRHNRRRLIRALEIIIITKKPVAILRQAQNKKSYYNFLKIGVKKSPEELKALIRKRLIKRLKIGMVKEVENLHEKGLSWKRLDDLGLEYRYISRYLRRLIAKQEMIGLIQKESEKYAKRQMTWFQRDKNIFWIKGEKEAIKLAEEFLINYSSDSLT